VASAKNPQPADAAEALERLGRLSLRELSMDSLGRSSTRRRAS
jgi:hypothetical protein